MSSQNPIDAVLEAEQAAEAEIERRRQATHDTINQALKSARTISERAHQRITNIHTHCAASVTRQCAALWQAYETAPETVIDDIATPARIDRVAERVAAKLTTKRSGDGNG